MFQLSPGEIFPVVRVLKDHADSETHFVRAVIKDAESLETLQTLDLTDNGNRIFSKNYLVPFSGVTGAGRYLVIITTVYDDSGYTVKSQNYAEESETYLVQDRWSPLMGGAGGGGSIDEMMMKKIIKEILSEIKDEEPEKEKPEVPEKENYPTAKEISDSILPLFKNIVDESISNIPKYEPEEQKEVDLSPITKNLSDIKALLKSIPKPQDFDDSEIVYAIDRLKLEIMKVPHIGSDQLQSYLNKLKEEIIAAIVDDEKFFKDMAEYINKDSLEREKMLTRKKFIQSLINQTR